MQKRVAVVTGASRGVGKGVALELCQAGFMVYITGRSAADMSYIQGKGAAIVCDHSNDQQVERMFAQISQEQGRIDVLVNNAWGGYENMMWKTASSHGRVHSGNSPYGAGTQCSRQASVRPMWPAGWQRH
jgi:dehydrogenase/reductase SDR family protein 1